MLKNNFFEKKYIGDNFIKYLCLAVFVFLLYHFSVFFGFTWFDDNWLVIEQASYYSDSANLLNIFKSSIIPWEYCYYRPVLIISFFINYFFTGQTIAALTYHFFNIVFHFISVALLFYMLKRFFFSKEASLAWSIIFACHPVLVQAVAWIPGRNDSILAIFILSSFIFFLKFMHDKKIHNILLSVFFWLGALLTKENAVVLPFLFLFYFIIEHQKFTVNKYDISRIFIFIILLLAAFFLYSNMRMECIGRFVPETLPLTSLIKGIPYVLAVYIGKIFLPFNLSVIPYMPDTSVKYGITAIIIIAAVIIKSKIKNMNFFLFGLTWFLLFLAPALIPTQEVMLEHRVYLPLAGLILSLGQIKVSYAEKLNPKLKTIVFIVLVSLFSVMTIKHSINFENPLVFWETAARQSPSYQAVYSNLGKVYFEREFDLEKAEKNFKKAYEMHPDEINKRNVEFIEEVKGYGGMDAYIQQLRQHTQNRPPHL